MRSLTRKNDKIKVKGAVSEGQEIAFKQALAMPTKPEAIGRVIGLALSPASRLLSQILGPATQVAGQIKTLSEKTPEDAQPAEAAPEPDQRHEHQALPDRRAGVERPETERAERGESCADEHRQPPLLPAVDGARGEGGGQGQARGRTARGP